MALAIILQERRRIIFVSVRDSPLPVVGVCVCCVRGISLRVVSRDSCSREFSSTHCTTVCTGRWNFICCRRRRSLYQPANKVFVFVEMCQQLIRHHWIENIPFWCSFEDTKLIDIDNLYVCVVLSKILVSTPSPVNVYTPSINILNCKNIVLHFVVQTKTFLCN